MYKFMDDTADVINQINAHYRDTIWSIAENADVAKNYGDDMVIQKAAWLLDEKFGADRAVLEGMNEADRVKALRYASGEVMAQVAPDIATKQMTNPEQVAGELAMWRYPSTDVRCP